MLDHPHIICLHKLLCSTIAKLNLNSTKCPATHTNNELWILGLFCDLDKLEKSETTSPQSPWGAVSCHIHWTRNKQMIIEDPVRSRPTCLPTNRWQAAQNRWPQKNGVHSQLKLMDWAIRRTVNPQGTGKVWDDGKSLCHLRWASSCWLLLLRAININIG